LKKKPRLKVNIGKVSLAPKNGIINEKKLLRKKLILTYNPASVSNAGRVGQQT
jgi:hypothetical protein